MRKWIWVAVCVSCFAVPESVERHAAQLRMVLRQADKAYYNSGEPIMGNAAYDALRTQYEKLVAEHPDLPAFSQVDSEVPDVGLCVEHTQPVLSLKKAYADDEVENFLEKCGLGRTYCLEPKLDGLTVVLRYRQGVLVQALTRGDGRSGMDVTSAILASGCVPAMLKEAPEKLEVRGEVVMSLSAFNALNKRRCEEGLERLKNPRNSAAGTLRLKDHAEIARRGLEVRIFELIVAEPMPSTHTGALAMISSLGLPVVESRAVFGPEVLRSIEEMNRDRADGPFRTDGIVVKIDDRAEFERLGKTAKYPRGAIARKYRAVPVETRLLRVEWTRGDTGRLTPVAHFEPIELDGATLQRASLHSLDHLRALDLMIGDRILVVRAGGTIPEVIGRYPDPRTGKEQPIPAPE